MGLLRALLIRCRWNLRDSLIMKSNKMVYLAAIVAVIFWGFSFVWEHFLISKNIEIFAFILERMALAALILWGIGVATRKLQRLDNKGFWWMFLLAFSEPFIYFIGENYGIKFTSSVIASLMMTLCPVFSMIGDRIFYKNKISKSSIWGALIAIIGVFCVVFKKGEQPGNHLIAGLLLLIVAVMASTGYMVCSKRLSVKYNAYTIVTWQFTFGAILFTPLFLLSGCRGLTSTFFTLDVQLTIFALAAACSGLCFGLWAYATAKLGITKTSFFSTLIPAVTAIVAFLFYPSQEPFSWLKVAGLVITVAGVTYVQKAGAKGEARLNS